MADPATGGGPAAGALVALHPEAVPDDERAQRWITPAGILGFVGPVVGAPVALQALLDDGTLEGLHVELAAVSTRLAPGRRWRDEGPRVRRALQAALSDPAGWTPAADTTPDDRLRLAGEEVVAGDVGDYVRSHGGHIEVIGAHQNRLEIRLHGACTHCPASDVTLTSRFETAVRARYPELLGTTVVDPPTAPRASRLLGMAGRHEGTRPGVPDVPRRRRR